PPGPSNPASPSSPAPGSLMAPSAGPLGNLVGAVDTLVAGLPAVGALLAPLLAAPASGGGVSLGGVIELRS
ncbi:hypothetical protein ACFFRE_03325, partial [Aciditerrimonas ferrireducens]